MSEETTEIWMWRDLADKAYYRESKPDFAGYVIKPRVDRFIRADHLAAERRALDDRITNYLENGGFFNPELMEHDKVRDLLMDCLAFLRMDLP